MRIKFIIAAILFIGSFADADTDQLQAQLQSEYGSCYNKFADNLQSCTPSSCEYPDLTDAQSWKAQVINGIVDKTCYVMYYSYIGQTITTNPDHCFYDRDTQALLVQLYRRLFMSGDTEEILALKSKIQYLSYNGCKKRDSGQSSAKQ